MPRCQVALNAEVFRVLEESRDGLHLDEYGVSQTLRWMPQWAGWQGPQMRHGARVVLPHFCNILLQFLCMCHCHLSLKSAHVVLYLPSVSIIPIRLLFLPNCLKIFVRPEGQFRADLQWLRCAARGRDWTSPRRDQAFQNCRVEDKRGQLSTEPTTNDMRCAWYPQRSESGVGFVWDFHGRWLFGIQTMSTVIRFLVLLFWPAGLFRDGRSLQECFYLRQHCDVTES